ncbi:basic blue protein-like [Salvia splendens]|uniref:basic blue protein-like n=1 Tax=Salvia splendens TaxID=180675 RepID=UPI0011006712|nr:basic blue protein-like [Salvia splendens]
MEGIKILKLSIFMIHLLLLDFGVCEVYRVGDGSGWNSGTGTNFLSWSQKYNFTVGDVLVFKYSKAQHNVKEVTDATYRSCNASNGVIAIYESGNDEIRLTDAKKYNFICDKDSHCIGGMRFSATVLEASTSNNTTPTGAPAPPSSAVSINSNVVHNIGVAALPLIFML